MPKPIKDFGKFWNESFNGGIYESMYNRHLPIHEEFLEWLKPKVFHSVLEVGCGDGIYSRKNICDNYTGIDMSGPSIREAVERRYRDTHNFIHDNFLTHDFKDKQYDLVFSHNAIDHVYDIPLFIKKCFNLAKKWVYISAYNGYFPDLERHYYEEQPSLNCYNNNLSVRELERGLKYQNHTIKSIISAGGKPATIIIISL